MSKRATITTIHGDCRTVLPTAGPFDACVTDPPYELGFMGKAWDRSGIAFQRETWRTVFDALKPGAHLVAFGGTRTFHRMACAIEDAGFELRDTLCWLYGSGFPKSLNLPGGIGTALKPAWEPIILARKPLAGTVAANVLAHGTGALNIEACRVATDEVRSAGGTRRSGGIMGDSTPLGGWESAPGVGRWPANLLHDGSDEVLDAFAAFGERQGGGAHVKRRGASVHCMGEANDTTHVGVADSGTAARFFYSAKATADDRACSKHPTVKPIALMRWLCRLIAPPGGHIVDPFAGSGTTGEAARLEGFSVTLIEQDAQHIADIHRRIGRASGADLPLLEGAG